MHVHTLLTNMHQHLRAILREMNRIPEGCPVPPDMHRAILAGLTDGIGLLAAAVESTAAPGAVADVIVRNTSAADGLFVVATPDAPAPALEATAAPEATPAAPGA